MASEKLQVILELITGNYKREAREAATATGQIGDAAQRTTGPIGGLQGAVTKLGGVLAGAFAVSGIVRFAGDSIKAASDLEESMNAVRVVFGEAAGEIEEFGKTSVDAVGLAAVNVNQSATVLGSALINAGLSANEAAGKVIELTTRAADMASVFNTEVPEALGAIQSALRGETDPIEKFGVSLTSAAVDAEAAALGYQRVGGEFDTTAKAAARLSIIMQQTERVSGDFANTADSTANTMKRLRERFTEMQGRIGQALMPAFKALLDVADKLAPAFEGIATEIANTVSEMKPLLEGLGTLVGWYTDIKGAIDDATESDNDFIAGLGGIADVLTGSGIGAIGKGLSFWDRFAVAGKDAAKENKISTQEIHDSWMNTVEGPTLARDAIIGPEGFVTAAKEARDRALAMRDANREAATSFSAELTVAIAEFVTFFDGAVDEIDLSLAELEEQFEERNTQNQRFWDGLAVLAAAGLDNLVEEIQDQGPAAAGVVEELVADMDRAFAWEQRIEEQERQAAALANAIANGLAGEKDTVGAAFNAFGISLADQLEAGFSTADLGNTLSQLMDLAGQGGTTTPSGGRGTQQFATGGVVGGPGPMGSPQMILAHKGETVIPAGQFNEMVMPINQFNLGGSSRSVNITVNSPTTQNLAQDLQLATILATVTTMVEVQN